jgi:hypothetical protein
MRSIKFASVRLVFPIVEWRSSAGSIKELYVLGLYEMLYTHAEVYSNWKILQAINMKTPYIYKISPFSTYLRQFYLFDKS